MSERTKGHKLFVVRQRPKSYYQTEQQKSFAEAATYCGIVKGISRDELIDKMQNCIPQFWEARRKEKEKGVD